MRLLDAWRCLWHLKRARWHEERAGVILDRIHKRKAAGATARRPTGPLLPMARHAPR